MPIQSEEQENNYELELCALLEENTDQINELYRILGAVLKKGNVHEWIQLFFALKRQREKIILTQETLFPTQKPKDCASQEKDRHTAGDD